MTNTVLAGAALAFAVGTFGFLEFRRFKSYNDYMKRRYQFHKYIVWYRAPVGTELEYLGWDDEQGGFYYTKNMDAAHRFDDADEAKRRCPVYDGSDGIETRSGVMRVLP